MSFWCILLVIAMAWVQEGSVRSWTDTKGRVIEGAFVRVAGSDVVLLIQGREVKVPLLLLCEEDQKFVAGQKPAVPAPAAADPPRRTKPADAVKKRVWTDTKGAKLTAQWVNVVGDQLQFNVENQLRLIPFVQFCEEDRQLVQEFMHLQGSGLKIPADVGDLPGMAVREWTDVQGQKAPAILRRFEAGEQVVLQFPNQVAKRPFQGFSEADQEFLRQAAAIAKLSHLLPKHPDERTWTDWTGQTFQARLVKNRAITESIELLGSEGPFTRKFLEFGDADRIWLREQVPKLGGNLNALPEFTEPPHPVRSWSVKSPATSQTFEAKLVRLEGNRVVLRSATSPTQTVVLDQLSGADRAYIHVTLEAAGQANLLPVQPAECVPYEFGPTGVGFTFLGKLDGVNQGRVQFRCLKPVNSRGDLSREVPFLCLSPASQALVRKQLLEQGKPLDVLTVSVANAGNYRDWNVDGRPVSAWLMYIEGSSISLGTGQTVTTTTNFDRLGVEDQEYIRLQIAQRGMWAFAQPKPSPPPPPPPPRFVPQQTQQAGEPGDYYEGRRVGRITGMGMLLCTVGLIVSFVGGVWLLVAAFSESVVWGLGCLFIPLVAVIFTITHMEKAGLPALLNLGGFGLYCAAFFLARA